MNISTARARVSLKCKSKRTERTRSIFFLNKKKGINIFFLRDKWYVETFRAFLSSSLRRTSVEIFEEIFSYAVSGVQKINEDKLFSSVKHHY